MNFDFSGTIWYWRGPAPWFFVSVPPEQGIDLRAIANLVTYGWGMIPVVVRIGGSVWETAMFAKDGSYVVPIKADIRTAENLHEGDEVLVQLEVRL